jgi:murein L,D-transpeptidase YafK
MYVHIQIILTMGYEKSMVEQFSDISKEFKRVLKECFNQIYPSFLQEPLWVVNALYILSGHKLRLINHDYIK